MRDEAEFLDDRGLDGGGGLGRRALVNMGMLTGSLLVSWTLALVGRFLLPHILGAERFGELAFLESIAAITLSVMSFGADGYVRREVAIDRDIARTFARPLAIMQFASGCALVAAMTVTLYVTSGGEQALIVAAFGGGQILLILGQLDSAYLSAIHKAGAVSASTVVTKIVWFAVLLGVLGAGAELLALPLAMLVSEAVRMLWVRRTVRHEFGRFDVAPFSAARHVMRESTPYFVNLLNMTFTQFASKILLGLLATSVATGLYATAMLAATIPMMLTPVLTWVMIPVLSSLRATSSEGMWARVAQLFDTLGVAAVALGVFLFVLSDQLIDLAFGSEFSAAGPAFAMAALLVPAVYFTLIMSSAFIADGRHWQNTKVNLYTMLLVVGLVAAALLLVDVNNGMTAFIVAAIELFGELVTVVALIWMRPVARPAPATLVRLVVLLVAVGLGAFDKLTDGSQTAIVAAIVIVVVTAVSDVPRLLGQLRTVLAKPEDGGVEDGGVEDGGVEDGGEDDEGSKSGDEMVADDSSAPID